MVEGMPEGTEEGQYKLHAYGDSESALSIAQMGTLLRKVRHIELRAAFLQQLVAKERLSLEHIPGKINPADALTKVPTTENLLAVLQLRIRFQPELGKWGLDWQLAVLELRIRF